MSSINTAANHQPALVGVAQHGSLDDAVYFVRREYISTLLHLNWVGEPFLVQTVSDNVNNGNGGNGGGGNNANQRNFLGSLSLSMQRTDHPLTWQSLNRVNRPLLRLLPQAQVRVVLLHHSVVRVPLDAEVSLFSRLSLTETRLIGILRWADRWSQSTFFGRKRDYSNCREGCFPCFPFVIGEASREYERGLIGTWSERKEERRVFRFSLIISNP